MCSIIDPSDDPPIIATLVLLEQWRARLVSHQAWHSDWEEVTSLDQAIATIKALQDETRGLRMALESPSNDR